MSGLNLDELSLSELKQLQKQVERAIASFIDRQKSKARAELEEAARKHGYSLADFLADPAVATRRRAPATAKYRHPENADITWSGRGRKPKWFEEFIARGKSPDDLAV